MLYLVKLPNLANLNNSFSNFVQNLACDSNDCLVWVAALFNVITIFVFGLLSLGRKSRFNSYCGYVWCAIAFVAASYILFVHVCIYTVLSVVFTAFLLVGILSTSIPAKKKVVSSPVYPCHMSAPITAPAINVAVKEEVKEKGMYVIRKSNDGTFCFSLYKDDRTLLATSMYVYKSFDAVKRAISVARNNGSLANGNSLVDNWVKLVGCPCFELFLDNNNFYFRLVVDPNYTIMLSNQYSSKSECEKDMKIAMQCIESSDVFYSQNETVKYTYLEIDPYIMNFANGTNTINNIAPVVEKVVEEPVEEPKKVEEEVAVTKAPVVPTKSNADDDENGDYGEMEIDNVIRRVRYNKSFIAKLSQSTSEVKEFYVETANYLAGYGIKCRTSWNYVSYNQGRNQICKLGVRGKAVRLYLSLEASEIKDTKYFVKPVDSAKYKDVPTLFKIKSARGVKFAKELIDACMAKYDIKFDETKVGNDKVSNYKTLSNEQLIKKDLIKYSVVDQVK